MAEILLNKPWALVSLSVSNLRAIPDHASELVSQVLMGTPLKVLDFKDKFYRVETPEHYLGWLDAKGLQLLTDQEMESWKKSDRFFYNIISGCAYHDPIEDGEIVTDLVLGDLFKGEPVENGYLRIWLPDGRSGYVKKSDCLSFDKWCSMEPKVNSVLLTARKMMGFPYLWGGASSKALDCSGFTKLLYYTQGIILARDASQQARYGEPVDISHMDNLEPGDLLFFGSLGTTDQPCRHLPGKRRFHPFLRQGAYQQYYSGRSET